MKRARIAALATVGLFLSYAAAGETLAPAEAAARVEPLLGEALSARGLRLAALAAKAPSWEIPDGAVVTAITLPAGALNLAALDLEVALARAGERLAPRRLRVAVAAAVPVVVTRGPVAAGEGLAGRVQVESRILDGPLRGLVESGDLRLRLAARRALPEGAIVRAADLRVLPEVEAGATVQVVLRQAGMALHASGMALATGRTGNEIYVRVFAGGRAVRGRVVAPGTVAVGAEEGSR